MKNFIVKEGMMKGSLIAFFIAAMALGVSCKSVPFAEIEASLPDMGGKPDGVYRGNYVLSGSPVKVILDVAVQNENIANIKIVRHSCSTIGKKAEKIIFAIMENQSLGVDSVSGATGSSKAILKAVENALR